MPGVLLIRPDDHLLLGVRWSGCTLSGGVPGRLTAGAQARLMLLLPPQHVGEESSPPGTAAPRQLPTGVGGGTVPGWSGVLSAPTRLTFALPVGVQVPLTAEAVLAAAAASPLLVPPGVPGPDDTAIEIPWRLVIAPRGPSGLVCRHLTRPFAAESSGLWRTRVVDRAGAEVTLRAVDPVVAGTADPVFAPGNVLPLARADRQRLVVETANRVARLDRLELTALGGTLDAKGVFDNFDWDQHTYLGRDMNVTTVARGALYPLGHRAEFVKASVRVFDPAAGGAAVLRTVRVLRVLEPVRHEPAGGSLRRCCPLGPIEITRTLFTDLAEAVPSTTTLPGVGQVGTHFQPSTLAGPPLRFPVAFWTNGGVVRVELPLLFVLDLRPTVDSLRSPVLAQRLAGDYGAVEVAIAPTTIDLAGTGSRTDADPAEVDDVSATHHEVRALRIGGATAAEGLDLTDGYRPALTELQIGLSALRVLTGQDSQARAAFARGYLQDGAQDVMLEMTSGSTVPIDFSKASDRSGGVLAPVYVTNAISQTLGPIDKRALPDPHTGFIDPATLFPSEKAQLLGFPLKSLLSRPKSQPKITVVPSPIPGRAPEVQMRWPGIALTSVGPFRAKPGATTLDLTIIRGPDRTEITCLVKEFTLELPPGPKSVLSLSFATLRFTQREGRSPAVEVTGVKANFTGVLTLLKGLAKACDLESAGKHIDVGSSRLKLGYSLPVPSIATGSFTISNMAFTAGIEIPFDGAPVALTLGFASRRSPFQLGVMMFGGGGYVELVLDRDGLRRFEAALEFGAFFAVNFVVARGEVHALGGVRFILERGEVTITGYLRIGGTVIVLGLLSVSVELVLSLTYRSEDNALVGRATLVIEIDLTLFSTSVELDSGEWKLAGESTVDRPFLAARSDPMGQWRAYRAAFAGEG